MKLRHLLSVHTRIIIKRLLKTSTLGRHLYPHAQYLWRTCVIPIRQRRLQRHGLSCLSRLHFVLTNHHIAYHCDYGTLLGFMRDHGFIPHDDDIDITIPLSETKQACEILKVFIEEGYQFLHGFSYEGRLYEFTVADPSGISVDVFFPRPCVESQYNYGFQPIWTPSAIYPSERANTMIRYQFCAPTGLSELQIQDVTTIIPSNANSILASEYGEGWRTPNDSFSTVCDRKHEVLPHFAYRLTLDEALHCSNK